MVGTIRRVTGRGSGWKVSSIGGFLFWAILGGNAKREIAFSQLQIPAMDQRSQPNQRLKLTQQERLVGKYDTLWEWERGRRR